MGASAILKSVYFRAFAVNVKTIAPKKYLYQSGHAIWWGMAPRAVCTFVERYNWKGKTLITYCTSNSSGAGDSAAEIGRLCKGAKRTKALSAYDDEILNSSLKKKIDKWLKSIKA